MALSAEVGLVSRAVAGAIVAIVVAASFAVGYLAGGSVQPGRTVTSTSTATARETVTSTVTSILASGRSISIADIETANLSLGRTTGSLAVNPAAGRVYDAVGGRLIVVDTSSHSVVANVTLPSRGGSVLTVAPGSGMVFVSVEGGILEINGSTNDIVGELQSDSLIRVLVYDQATDVIYGSTLPNAGEYGNSSVIGWDVQTGSVVLNMSLGYIAYDLAVNTKTNTIYAAGCDQQGVVCDSKVSLVDGTSGTVSLTVSLNSAYYAVMTYDATTNMVYVSGEESLVALNGTTGAKVFQANPDTCGPFDEMVVISSLNQLLVVPSASNYLLVYDGTSGALVNMYQSTTSLSSVVYDPVTNEIYLADYSGRFLAFPNLNTLGNVNATIIGAGETCLPP